MEKSTIEKYFEQLDILIDRRNQSDGFQTAEQGVRRDVQASEFMLMTAEKVDGNVVLSFKHHFTRNYVQAIQYPSGICTLNVPANGKAFTKGEFDKCDL
jgi:hypothetical protein